jgi:hypothetical protein
MSETVVVYVVAVLIVMIAAWRRLTWRAPRSATARRRTKREEMDRRLRVRFRKESIRAAEGVGA